MRQKMAILQDDMMHRNSRIKKTKGREIFNNPAGWKYALLQAVSSSDEESGKSALSTPSLVRRRRISARN